MPKCESCGIRDDACVEDADGTFCIYCRTLALEMRGYNVPMPDVEAMERYAENWKGEPNYSGIRCAAFLRRRRESRQRMEGQP
jgi:hypothetical protein